MATKPTWASVSPSSGSGDGSVAVSASEHTGREARQGVITWKANNCEDVERNIIQAGKPEFVSVDSATVSVGKEGGTITISGTTNSSKLTFSLGSGDLPIELPSSYTANSVNTTNGAEISGDPGTDAEFPFSVTITVPANTSIDDLSKQVIVTDAAGNTATTTIEQASGDAYLIVEEGDINLDYLGTAVSVSVESNTNWTVE